MPPPDREIRTTGALLLAAGLLAVALAILGERLGLGADVARETFGWQRGILLAAGLIAGSVGTVLLLRPQLVFPLSCGDRARHGEPEEGEEARERG